MTESFKVNGVFGGPSFPAAPPQIQLNNEESGSAFKYALNAGCVISAPIAGGLFTLNPVKILGRAGAWAEILMGDWLQKDGKYIDAERRYVSAQALGDSDASKVALTRIAKMYERWGMELRLKDEVETAIDKFRYAADKWKAIGKEGNLEYRGVWSRIAIIYQSEAVKLAEQKRYAEAAVVWFDCMDAWKKGGAEETAHLLQGIVSSYDSRSLLGAAELLLKKGTALSEQGRHNEAGVCFQNGAKVAAMAVRSATASAIRTKLNKLGGLFREGMQAVDEAVGGALKVVGRFGGAKERDTAFLNKLACDASIGNRGAMRRLKDELAKRDVSYEEFKTALEFGQRHKLARWGLDGIDSLRLGSLLFRAERFKTWGGRPVEAGRFMRKLGR